VSQITPTRNPRRNLLLTVALAIVIITVSSAAIFGAWRAYRIWSASERLPAELPNLPHVQFSSGKPMEPPDPIRLNTISMRSDDKRRLLNGDFKIVTRMSDIAESCRDSFDSSFVRFSGSPASKELVKFADPGQEFETSDSIRGGLPFRRLVFAGVGSNHCFVYYEIGGHYPTTCLAVMDYAQKKAIWVGMSRRTVESLEALRGLFAGGCFADTYGPVC